MKFNKKGRRVLFAAALVATAGVIGVSAMSVHADQTGASASKNCPQAPVGDPYTIGDTITCAAAFANTGESPATIVDMTEQAPWISNGDPGNGPIIPLTCTTVITQETKAVGDTLNPGQICISTFPVVIPNDPALCNSVFRDRAAIAFEYPLFDPPLSADAGATATVAIVCVPSITVTKTAEPLGKVTDPVNYTITICNTGVIPVTKGTVVDSLVGDISANFAATLAAGTCDAVYGYSRVVVAGDPDPLVNTVIANYSAGAQQATAQSSATTNLFVPGVSVSKDCSPAINVVGGTSTCTIVVTNTSGADSPALVRDSIVDSLSGDLTQAANVVDSNCGATLALGASCTIHTARVILASDPNPVVNTVTVHYHPEGFTNDITANASDSVGVVTPSITVTKSATGLSKVGDPVTYTIRVCNSGPIDLTRDSVIDAAFPNITTQFAVTLAPGACTEVTLSRNVPAGSSDPLINTVTATYSGLGASATATASAQTNLFQPAVSVTKNCSPDPIQVGQAELCTIVITNNSSSDAPTLVRDSISDSLSGSLIAPNPAIVDSNCGATLAGGASCTIHTSRVVLMTDVSPLVNTVTVHYHPQGFTNDITASASDSVVIERGGEGCTPGYWKQTQHFDSWVGYTPNQSFNTVFGVNVTLSGGTTLLGALQSGGGGIDALARHAVAALLNSSNSGVESNFTTAQVIAIVQSGINPGGLTVEQAKNLLAAANEQGCPLN